MAIFVALIFQILFVFFAMAINIGLVVHDKINLQNAVDLAAYYAAQRQAEILNVIAHTNYQIHQSWKLLNWRYYVLGTMGNEGNNEHPAFRNNAPRVDTSPGWPPVATAPVLCITQRRNWEFGLRSKDKPNGSAGQDNPCKSDNFTIPNIPDVPVLAPFNPINAIFSKFVKATQNRIAESCQGYAGVNWYYAASIYAAYLKDQQSRKELIRALASNLARKPSEMLDLDGDSILVGAQKTFIKNLTYPNNSDPRNPPQIEIYNSLEGLDSTKWLNEMDVYFTMFYQELTGDSKNCSTVINPIYKLPDPAAVQSLKEFTGDQTGESVKELLNIAGMGKYVKPGDSFRMSIGVEKNPWYLAYVGVKAKTKPRQLFFPFGDPIEFEARAYAQPFGGRIGPWYGRAWSRNASESSGENLGLAPPKLNADGSSEGDTPKDLVPMYSKYPGDKMGLKSFLAQSSMTDQKGIKASVYDYADINKGFGEGKINDILAAPSEEGFNVRNYEIAAVAPDLFDITYYSIQPNFPERYLKRLINNRKRFGIEGVAFPRGDLGSRAETPMSIETQIQIANIDAKIQAPDAFWYVRDKAHLLTSWVHSDTYGEYFEFPKKRFGNCDEDDSKVKMKAPGACLDNGGRVGYSVKIISPEILYSPLPLGGPGQSEGEILNPPPENW
ncbi:MAG: Tad domain-containing protein [Bdellovibrionales bacterium]|nr:Tad domain-containing protein [Bdellovibrionales bacterium]